jgi:hypothetical protein
MTPGIAPPPTRSAETQADLSSGLEAAGAIAIWAGLGAALWVGVLQLVGWL